MSQISERRVTATVGVAVAVFSIYLLWLTAGFPPGRGAPGPAVWPRIVLVMSLLGALNLAASPWFRSTGKTIETRRLMWPAIILLLTILYVFALDWAFFPSTGLFLFVCMLILRVRSWPVLIGVSIGFPLVVYLVFVQLLHLSFPSLLSAFGS